MNPLAGVSDRSSADPLSPKNQTRTPAALYAEWDDRYGFSFDAAAAHENALCDLYATVEGTFSKTLDGPRLINPFDGVAAARYRQPNDGPTWINPPFGTGLVEPFVRAWAQAYLQRGIVSVMLLPSRTEQPWFHRWVLPYAHINWIEKRVAFDDHQGNHQGGAGFPCFVAEFR